MAVKYQYLVDPLLGFQTKSGSLNTAGIIRVFDAATDDPVVTYKDFAGTENAQDIRLDDNGRAVVIADDSRAYRIDVCDRYGALMYNQTPMYAKGGGGGVMTNVTITSEDGTVDIDTSSEGGVKNFDLSVKHDDPEYAVTNSWYVKGDGTSNHCGYIVPQGRTDGNMDVTWEGILLKGGSHYHVDAWIDAKADNDQSDPGNAYRTRDMLLNFRLLSDNGTPVTMEFDNSFPHRETYNLSGDLHPLTDTYLKVYFDNYDWVNYQSGYITQSHLEMPRLSVHSIVGNYYGTSGGGGTGGLDQVYHDSTLLGNGTQENALKVAPITISMLDPSFRAVVETQSDWTESDTTSAAYIQHKPDLSQFATQDELDGKQDTLIAGDNITIVDNRISASATGTTYTAGDGIEISNDEIAVDFDSVQHKLTAGSNITIDPSTNTIYATAAPQVQSNWTEADTSSPAFIQNKPHNLVQDPNYVHTDNNFSNTYVTKLDGIESDAEVNKINIVKVDGTALNIDPRDRSVNIPPAVATGQTGATAGAMSANDKQKLDGIQTGAEVNVQSDWNETNSGSDAFILNKPQNLVQDPDYVHTDNNYTDSDKQKLSGVESGAQVNVQSDWNETDVTSDAYILNKPPVLGTKNLVPGTNIMMVQSNDDVIISATNLTSTYDTQPISAGSHIQISPTAQISTDLTESGELVAFYDVSVNYNAPSRSSSTSGETLGSWLGSPAGPIVVYANYDPDGIFTGNNELTRLLINDNVTFPANCIVSVRVHNYGVMTPVSGKIMALMWLDENGIPIGEIQTKAIAQMTMFAEFLTGNGLTLTPFKIFNASGSSAYISHNGVENHAEMDWTMTVTVRKL